MSASVALVFVAVVLVVLCIALAMAIRAAPRGATGGATSGATGGATGGAAETAELEVNFGPRAPLIDPKAVRGATAAALRAVPGFAPASGSDPRIRDIASRFGLAPGAVASLRTMELSRLAGPASHRARSDPRLGREFSAARREGPEALVAAAHRARVPPMAALRAAGDGPPTEAELAVVGAADIGSRIAGEATRARATAFEHEVGAVLRAQHIEFRTEDDLRAAATAAGAPPPALTPDFLIDGRRGADGTLSPVTFRGRPLRWVDAKNYPGTGHRLTAAKLVATAAKYHAAFGPGAFVFAGGIMRGYDPAPDNASVVGFVSSASN